ncbi:NAD(P)/FAD-dependent oxidoreductase [Oscillatoriales cyanobacterium LEGE 11467]|uniref:NAD(P)/FAD-dependent oxidoreductase n=1 Tax=Zarconia navalis LEGE 11467 TaxID=1828826 RepID=A0A928W0L3_9CYAN|nr:NAD(P)/FAD-dependent oxidoreductase [Zarconia navalis]MBE9041100.1 NAD(P)/FAD-dependent oxidoreductase [Zarconia navalis LEGE 11467]
MNSQPNIPNRAIVIGGGAAGYFGAIACARTYPEIQVMLLEAGRQPLSKVRISGGGRCNVTHSCFDPVLLVQNYPRGGKALRGAFSRFQPRDTVGWFENLGIALKTEADGRMFPTTDDSETIANGLIEAAREAGVKVLVGTPAVGVRQVPEKEGCGFEVALRSGKMMKGDRLLLATGSSPKGYRWAQDLGHTIESPVPSLFTFNISDGGLRALAGISVPQAKVRLPQGKLAQEGPLLVTHWGLSGPAVLKLSAWGARFLHDRRYNTQLQVNWLPQQDEETLRQTLQTVRSETAKKAIASSCPFPLPKRLWQYLLDRAKIEPGTRWTEFSKKALNALVGELVRGEYQIAGKGAYKEEFVTCGGVKLKEVNFKTMESRRCPHLYFAGEILDIDGVTGGFNFQSAWTTSWIAGQAMGRKERERGG